MRNDRGFTMIETVIVLAVALVIAGGVLHVLSQSRQASRIAELDSQTQQNARAAIDNVIRDLRSNGYGVDVGNGQTALVFAGPNDVIFNANISPVPDNGSIAGYPTAISTSASPPTVPASGTILYAPSSTFDTGAETIRFTFDSTNDGVINASDKVDDAVEQTQNPNDYVLIRQVYGYDGSSNGGTNEPIALLRGPDAYDDGTYPNPLFTYWYDHDDDTSTPDRLWGDGSGNGELEDAEIAGLTPVSLANIGRVNYIGITATGAARAVDMEHSGDDAFRETLMTSQVSVRRSRPSSAAYIRGIVFDDLTGDGTMQHGEPGLNGVTVRLNTGIQKQTGADGTYAFRVDPGEYTVNETDPVGYNSTTPNAVGVTAIKGGVAVANFGDRAIGGYGGILGLVRLYDDTDGDGDLDLTAYGINGVQIYLNTGERDTTDVRGSYAFLVPASSYSITMVVPSGYLAVGPATVTRTIPAEGDTVMVNFGLEVTSETGTIAGKVYVDTDEDGTLDLGESGIASVMVRLSTGDSTDTDASGDYSFTVLPGTYDVTEEDLGGYTSTTINNVTGVVVATDSVSTVDFGDMLAADLSFTVITLGETQRALCIASADLGEKGDSNLDQEIILGTKYVSGISNLNVWKNLWENQSTPNSAVFDQTPWYSVTPNEDIFSVASGDVNGDSRNDVLSGLTSSSGKTLVWITMGNGNNAGKLPSSPSSYFISSGSDILTTVLHDANIDGDLDALIGTKYFANQGRFEVWSNNGSGSFSHSGSDVYELAGGHLLGAVTSLAVGDIAGNGYNDVVLGTATGAYAGKIEIFTSNGASGTYSYFTTIEATGEVNAVALCDMLEDSDGDVDIIVGTSTGVGMGWVELWHNNSDGTFGVDYGGGTYSPSDTIQFNGEVLCLGVEHFDRDVYPDLAVGLKNSASYTGEIRVFQCYGYLPSADNSWISPDIGEAITMTVNDFNKDYAYDMAAGTRTTLSNGHVVVFFNDNN
ncbi:MAG: SdrD B-like domain-containing protein [Candidatus Eisenbacteria bacterium]